MSGQAEDLLKELKAALANLDRSGADLRQAQLDYQRIRLQRPKFKLNDRDLMDIDVNLNILRTRLRKLGAIGEHDDL